MKYVVKRTSDRESNPCDEAYQGEYIRVDARTWSSPALYLPGGEAGWLSKGTNHRIEENGIKRDLTVTGWFVDIATLDDLMTFIGTYGEVVIGRDQFSEEYSCIEIYDDYRE